MAKEYLDKDGLLYFWQKLKATFALISHTHTKSQITDFPTTMTPSSHAHGNIQNGGTLQTTDVAIANGDKLVVTDSSNSNKIARSSASFDGSTTTTALTPKGTFESFAKAADLPTKTSDLTNDSNFVADASYVHTDNNYSTTEKNKLAGIEAGAEANVQSDWNQTDNTADDYIKNKPTIPSSVTVDSALSSTSENPVQNKVINTALNGKANGNARIFYGTCSTAASTANKEITCTSYDNLTVGDIIIVNFTNTNSNNSPRLNVNSTGNKEIAFYKNGIRTFINSTTKGLIGQTNMYIYDGLVWILCLEDTDTTYDNATTSVAGLMSATDKGKVDKLVFTGDKIAASILPSYVDDVIEAYPRSGETELSSTWLSETSGGAALTPETGKIYILMADSTSYAANSQFRWSGSAYIKLADGGVSEITNAEIDTIVAS